MSVSSSRPPRWATVALSTLLLAAATRAQDDDGPQPLTGLSLEELLRVDVTVTSVAKKPQNLQRTPAAVYVLTQEEIRRSGVTSVAEALRMVPGMHVARFNSHSWEISTRGFNDGFSNKLLVLIDGRAVYNLLQAGVYWDVQDLVLEDIDRVEVIRGPGGAVWGSNAVNGVINIITKDAASTQGNLVTIESGTEDRHIVTARHGGTTEGGVAWRAYVKSSDRDAMEFAGTEDLDDWFQRRAGFRTDWSNDDGDEFTVQGDVYDGRVDEFNFRATPTGVIPLDVSTRIGGVNLLSRWTREISDENTVQLQAYYDRVERDDELLSDTNNTFDIEFTQHLSGVESHDVVWGANYRVSQSNYENSDQFILEPDPRTKGIISLFAQDEIELVDDEFWFTLGSKFENNSFTGWEVQPTMRFAWAPDPAHTIWGAVSRSVRTPSPIERDGTIAAFGVPGQNPGDPDTLFAFVPGPDFDVERVYAFELGYRAQLSDDFAVDIATYYNDFAKLGTEELGANQPLGPGTELAPFVAENNGDGIGRGVEVGAEYIVSPDWELEAAYTYTDLTTRANAKSNDIFFSEVGRSAPEDIYHLRSHHQLSEDWELDLLFYYTSKIPTSGIDRAIRSDVRFGWRPTARTEIAFGARNLGHEGDAEATGGNEIEPEGYVRGTFRF